MAETVITIRLTYENGGHFRMVSTGGNGEEPIVVCHIQENGEIAKMWPQVQKICTGYFDSKMTDIGVAMKAEGGG